MKNELYVDSIEFSYDSRVQLLTGVYLSCKIGEIVGLLGRNGCGKSTLMKIIFGVLTPKHAYIRINGRNSKKAFLLKEVLYLPQDSFLPTDAKVSSLLRLLINDQTTRQKLSKDERIKSIVNQKVYSLSGGERRYLEIVLLLHQKGSYVLLDEPFSGIEPIYVEAIQQLIVDNTTTKGFIISDHDYQNVLDITTRITLLKDGGCMQISDKRDLELFYVPEGTFSTDK